MCYIKDPLVLSVRDLFLKGTVLYLACNKLLFCIYKIFVSFVSNKLLNLADPSLYYCYPCVCSVINRKHNLLDRFIYVIYLHY